jgi:Acetyltransferase (GNAT) domain
MVKVFARFITFCMHKFIVCNPPPSVPHIVTLLDHCLVSPTIRIQSLPRMTTSNDDTSQINLQKRRIEKINWIIRPATVQDRDKCADLIRLSYSSQLSTHYSAECLEQCLPLITNPREELLTCNTWYLAEHPATHQIVGCGGWTVRQPQAEERLNDDSNVTPSSCMDTSSTPPLVPHLRHFASHPDYPRCGIASAIWKRTQQDIAHQFEVVYGRPFPVLEVFSTLNAEPFYESCGFVVVERLNIAIAKDAIFPATLMRRDPQIDMDE